MDDADEGRSAPDEMRVVYDLEGEGRVRELCELYDQWEWWADRDREAVERALAHTDVQVGLVDDAVAGEVAGSGGGAGSDGGAASGGSAGREEGAGSDQASGSDGRLVAHARVLTDHTYYGRIHDVIVEERRRGEGVGTRLLREVIDHPELQDVSVTLLVAPDTVEFYERCGFEFIGTDTDWQTMIYRR